MPVHFARVFARPTRHFFNLPSRVPNLHSKATSTISPPSSADSTQPFERCLEVTVSTYDAHDEAARFDPAPQMPTFLFHYVCLVFDAVVALAGAFPGTETYHIRAHAGRSPSSTGRQPRTRPTLSVVGRR